MELPDEIVRATDINPRTMLFYTKPKTGKTTVLSMLTKCLIVGTEDGSRNVDGLKIEVKNFKELRDAAQSIYLKGFNKETNIYTPPYTYLAVDTLTRIDEWSEIEGTFKYMKKPQGKSFNRKEGKKDGEWLSPKDDEFETVHEIGQGFGYKYSRETVTEFFDKFNQLAPHIIYVCHIKDKFVGTTNAGNEVITTEINLTGKLKDIISSKVDTIANGTRKGGKFILSFTQDAGSRSTHLSGRKIEISESFTITEVEYLEAKKKSDGKFNRFRLDNVQYDKIKLSENEFMFQKLETHWDKIFIKS